MHKEEKPASWIARHKKHIKTAIMISGGILAGLMLLQSFMSQIVFAAFIDEENVQKMEYGYIMPMRAGEWEIAYAIMDVEENAIYDACKAMRSSWRLSVMLNPLRTYRNLRRAFTDYSKATWRNYQRTRGYVKYERDKLRRYQLNKHTGRAKERLESKMTETQAMKIIKMGE